MNIIGEDKNDNAGIDRLYNVVYDLIKEKKWDEINSILSALVSLDAGLKLAIAGLTICFTSKEHIDFYESLLNYAKFASSELGHTEEQTKSVLYGLSKNQTK